jgi:hypothetical protein
LTFRRCVETTGLCPSSRHVFGRDPEVFGPEFDLGFGYNHAGTPQKFMGIKKTVVELGPVIPA